MGLKTRLTIFFIFNTQFKMENLKKLLITGANGFIGSNLTEKLVAGDFEVGIIKRQNSDMWRIKNLLNKIKIYDADLQDGEKVSEAVSDFKPDAILHLATHYSLEHKPQEASSMAGTNTVGTINLLEASNQWLNCLSIQAPVLYTGKAQAK